MAGLFLGHLLVRMEYYSKPGKEQFREAVYSVAERDHLYEDSLIIGYSHNRDYFNYYFERSGSSRRIDAILGEAQDISKARELIASSNPRYVWYVRAHRMPEPEFIGFLEQTLTLLDRQEHKRADVWLFENESA